MSTPEDKLSFVVSGEMFVWIKSSVNKNLYLLMRQRWFDIKTGKMMQRRWFNVDIEFTCVSTCVGHF